MLINLCVTENLLFTAERNANKQLLFFKKKEKENSFPSLQRSTNWHVQTVRLLSTKGKYGTRL